MKVSEGQRLKVNHSRSGKWEGVATKDFDTEEEFYPIKLDQDEPVHGMSTAWIRGDNMPCRDIFCKLSFIE